MVSVKILLDVFRSEFSMARLQMMRNVYPIDGAPSRYPIGSMVLEYLPTNWDYFKLL